MRYSFAQTRVTMRRWSLVVDALPVEWQNSNLRCDVRRPQDVTDESRFAIEDGDSYWLWKLEVIGECQVLMLILKHSNTEFMYMYMWSGCCLWQYRVWKLTSCSRWKLKTERSWMTELFGWKRESSGSRRSATAASLWPCTRLSWTRRS